MLVSFLRFRARAVLLQVHPQGGQQFLLNRPLASRAYEHIGRARFEGVVVISGRTDDCGVAVESNTRPEVVKVVFLMLLRDMMQPHRATIVKDAQTQNWDTHRIEQFIVGLFYEAQAPIQPYQDWLEVVQSHDEEPSTTLITGLAQQIAVDPKMLFLYHMTACDVTGEDVLS